LQIFETLPESLKNGKKKKKKKPGQVFQNNLKPRPNDYNKN
jgi:hypothetical protein